MDLLLPSHFLSQPRPDTVDGPPPGVVDTTTLAAHDFDVDTRTGFMPPDPPMAHLPEPFEPWEVLLDEAQAQKLQLGRKPDITDAEKQTSESWRARVRELPTIPITDLSQSEVLLRRAHHVLAWLMHFYIHSLPPADADVHIPAPITVPLLQICVQLQLPPVVTYSDDVLYNWALKHPSAQIPPAADNLRSLTLFTGTPDEQAFYLSSARIELRGVAALDIMRATMDELFVGDTLARRRITRYLAALAPVIDDLTALLLGMRAGCHPDVFYRDIRPWFCGADSGAQKWVFDGLDDHPELAPPSELSGPSAAQSALVHALDIFLGVSEYSHADALSGRAGTKKGSFLARMQAYMPRHHRAFLRHLAADPRPLRAAVEDAADPELRAAYNAAVQALKRFRDAHMRIVALYIVGPARRFGGRGARGDPAEEQADAASPLRGTGGTELVRFLKGVRDQTAGAVLEDAPRPSGGASSLEAER